MTDRVYDVSHARKLWSINASRWVNHGMAYWLEWDHPLEHSRSLSALIENCALMNFERLIRPASTCIDIGAHSGDTAIPIALFAYDKKNDVKGTVVAVEPNPELISVLTGSLSLNEHLANFYVENCAVTERDGIEIELSDHGNANCNGGIVADYSEELTARLHQIASTNYKSTGRSLASIMKSHSRCGNNSDISFIKIDCEGYDKNILRSSRDILQSVKPNIFVEWFAMFNESDNADFIKVFDEINYKMFHPITLEPLSEGQRVPDVIGIHMDNIDNYS